MLSDEELNAKLARLTYGDGIMVSRTGPPKKRGIGWEIYVDAVTGRVCAIALDKHESEIRQCTDDTLEVALISAFLAAVSEGERQ